MKKYGLDLTQRWHGFGLLDETWRRHMDMEASIESSAAAENNSVNMTKLLLHMQKKKKSNEER